MSGSSTSKNNKSGCTLAMSFSLVYHYGQFLSKEACILSQFKLRFSRATSSSSTIATLYLSMFLLCFSSREYIHNPTPIQSNRRSFTDYLSVNMPILAKIRLNGSFKFCNRSCQAARKSPHSPSHHSVERHCAPKHQWPPCSYC